MRFIKSVYPPVAAFLFAVTIFILVSLPAVISALAVQFALPDSEFRFHFSWWTIPILSLSFFLLTFVVSAVKVGISAIIPPHFEHWYGKWGVQAVEFVSLVLIYYAILSPFLAAIIAAGLTAVFSLLVTPVIDRKLERD